MAKGVAIGLSNLVYAKLISDNVGDPKATYETPVPVPGAISATINPNTSEETLFADDGPYETGTTLGAISLELNVADLPLETQAELFGHTYEGGILVRKSADTPPWVAVGFKTLKSNGSYRYTWLAKGKFNLSEQANETRGDSISFQTPTANGSFVKRECDDEWERHADEDAEGFTQEIADNWFKNPYAEATGSGGTEG